MTTSRATAAPLRCLFVWAAATAVVVVLLRLLLPEVVDTLRWFGNPSTAPATLEEALADVAALLLAGCLVWWWVATSTAVVEAATAVRLGPCPRLLRRAVLMACGIGLVSGLSPASADQSAGHPPTPSDQSAIAGLQLPDRQAVDTVLRPTTVTRARASSDRTTTVRPGDSLWSIAAADLPPGTDNALVDARWREIWAANRAVIGSDPDLIHPDVRLHLRHSPHQEEK
ncbi:hypothetical protein ASG90_14355 [Nocardioides sp. Soil797]|nr:hypothetical protein ASG90_14355 [Nocardioides sp. Soil797]